VRDVWVTQWVMVLTHQVRVVTQNVGRRMGRNGHRRYVGRVLVAYQWRFAPLREWRQASRSQASWLSFSRRPRTNPEVILSWSVPAAEGVGFLANRDGFDSMCAAPFRSGGMAGQMPSGQRTGKGAV
jgi:hypothetical protein